VLSQELDIVLKIDKPFSYYEGDSPILVSMPHSGLCILPEMNHSLTDNAKKLPDTDWHIPALYDFLSELDVSVISANYSRYVIDLNRSIDDKPLYSSKTTGLFPDILFENSPVFLTMKHHSDLRKEQVKQDIWVPYHGKITKELARIKAKFGYAILFDAHSIAAEVPMLFEGTLPDFNFGNNDGVTCAPDLLACLIKTMATSDYSAVCNGRFKGGYITRYFGQPKQHIHAIQLELSQATYLDQSIEGYCLDKAKKSLLSPLLQQLIEALLIVGKQLDLTEY
jgi:N-formylglutamate deformylase